MAEETISGAMVGRLVRVAERYGLRGDEILRAASLSRAELDGAGARVSYERADRLLEVVSERLPEIRLGLELALTRVDESYGAAGLLLVSAGTFRRGLKRSFSYQRLWGDGERFSLDELPSGDLAIGFRHPGKSLLGRAVSTECAFVEVVEGLRALVLSEAIPRRVEFSHELSGDAGELEEHFGIRLLFGAASNRLVLPSELVDRPMNVLSELLTGALERQASLALSLLPERSSIKERVRGLLVRERGLGLTLGEAADLLRVSSRTLQRKLHFEGTSYEELVEGERKKLALELERRGVPAKEIAFQLGFSEPSAFSRAKRRWRANA